MKKRSTADLAVLRNYSKVYPYVGIIQIRLPVGGNTSLSACHTSSRLFKVIIHPFVEKSSAAGNISMKKVLFKFIDTELLKNRKISIL